MQLFGVVMYLLLIRRSVRRKYEQHWLTNLSYFDHPIMVLQMQSYAGIHCSLHLGMVSTFPASWLMRLRSCRDLDRDAHLAHFTLVERSVASLFAGLLFSGLFLTAVICAIRLVIHLGDKLVAFF
jgi:hypothetical protein